MTSMLNSPSSGADHCNKDDMDMYNETIALYRQVIRTPLTLRPGDCVMTFGLSDDQLTALFDRFVSAGCIDSREYVSPERYLFMGWEVDSNEVEGYDEPLYFSDAPRLLWINELLDD